MASIKPLNCPQETAETACQLGATLKLSKLTLGVICVGPPCSGLRAPFLPLFCPKWLGQVSDNWTFLDTCLSSLFCCCDKHQISASGGEKVLSGSRVKVRSIMVGKARQQKLQAAAHITSQGKQKKMNTGTQLALARTLAQGMVPTILKSGYSHLN